MESNKEKIFNSESIHEARRACHTLMKLNKMLTTSKEDINEDIIIKARKAATTVNVVGYFSFRDDTTNIEFFKEVQAFANNFENFKKNL